jgi:hypothetical protein
VRILLQGGTTATTGGLSLGKRLGTSTSMAEKVDNHAYPPIARKPMQDSVFSVALAHGKASQ